MAQRRMFALRIIDSAKFIKMPMSARLLYYDLGMRADDDGIVEAYNVLKMNGTTEDDLKVLLAKKFVEVLNEDLVTFICDWKEHNKIRPDRKIDSIYKDLLLQVFPMIKLIEPRERADLKRKNMLNNEWTSNGQPMDGIGKVSLSKERVGKDSLVKVSLDKDIIDKKIENIQNKWNQIGVKEVINIDQKRYEKLQIILNENSIEKVYEAIGKVNNSSFLKGQNKDGWIISFDWFIDSDNFYKILEDNYKDRKVSSVNSFNNFEPRDYESGYAGETYKSLEEKLLGWDTREIV